MIYYHRKSIDKGTNDHKQNFVTVTHNLTTNIQFMQNDTNRFQ